MNYDDIGWVSRAVGLPIDFIEFCWINNLSDLNSAEYKCVLNMYYEKIPIVIITTSYTICTKCKSGLNSKHIFPCNQCYQMNFLCDSFYKETNSICNYCNKELKRLKNGEMFFELQNCNNLLI